MENNTLTQEEKNNKLEGVKYLIMRQAGRRKGRIPFEDLEQIGTLGAMLAISRLKEGSLDNTTYIYNYIDGFMLRAISNEIEHTRTQIIEDIVEQKENNTDDWWEHVTSTLTDMEKKVIYLYYRSGLRLCAIAKQYKISRNTAGKYRDSAIEKMKLFLRRESWLEAAKT